MCTSQAGAPSTGRPQSPGPGPGPGGPSRAAAGSRWRGPSRDARSAGRVPLASAGCPQGQPPAFSAEGELQHPVKGAPAKGLPARRGLESATVPSPSDEQGGTRAGGQAAGMWEPRREQAAPSPRPPPETAGSTTCTVDRGLSLEPATLASPRGGALQARPEANHRSPPGHPLVTTGHPLQGGQEGPQR